MAKGENKKTIKIIFQIDVLHWYFFITSSSVFHHWDYFQASLYLSYGFYIVWLCTLYSTIEDLNR